MKRRLILAMALSIVPIGGQTTYSGPSVLSRGPVGNLGAGSDLLVIQPSLQLLGSYESGLYLASVDSSGRQRGVNSYGVTAIASLTGYHRWKHTILGLNYQGNFRHYTQNKYMDGIDQAVSLNIQNQLSPHTTLSLTGTGGTFSRGYGLGGGLGMLNYGDYTQGTDPTLAAVPRIDLLDARTYYAAGGADVIHQKSARLSFRAGGTAYAVRRRSRFLVEMNGYNARADAMYRLSRTSTLGIDYSFDSYRFIRSFGSSDFHTTALNFATRLGRYWTLSLRGGGYRMENLRTVSVALDPAVAAILGQTTGIEAWYKITYGTVFGASLSRNFRRAGLGFRYERGVTPGNAVFLTSRRETGGVSFSYRGWRRWSLSFYADASRNITLFQGYGAYKSYTGGSSASYRVGRFIHLVANAAERRYELSGATDRPRNSSLVSIGLGFAPGELPLSIW